MPERVAGRHLESRGGGVLDHARIEVHAVRADAALFREGEERAAAAAEIAHPGAAGEEVDELRRLRGDDRLVAAEARLEVFGMEIRGHLVALAGGEGLLDLPQPRVVARRRPIAL